MNQEDVLVLLVVFVLGFVVSQMMSGRLVEGSEGNPSGIDILTSKFKFSNLTPDDTDTNLMACLTPNGVKKFPCDISDDSDNKLVTINMNTGEMVDQTEVMKGDQCNDLFYEKNNVRSDEANICLRCALGKDKQCCDKEKSCPLDKTYVPGFKLKYDLDQYDSVKWPDSDIWPSGVPPQSPPSPPSPSPPDCCEITNENDCNSPCQWDPDKTECQNGTNFFGTMKYIPCPPSNDDSQSDTSENN